MNGHGTLSRRLALQISAGLAVVWLLAVLATALVLKSEQEEMLDLELRQTAGILHPILADAYQRGLIDADGGVPAAIAASGGADLALVFALVSADGRVLLISSAAQDVDLPQAPLAEGYFRTGDHAFFTTRPDGAGLAVHVGDPLAERGEAYRESFLAFLIPMLAILPLAYLMVGVIARSSLRPLRLLEAQIDQRGDARLDPIDASGQPEELRRITGTLNSFMIRLGQALEGERSFATNAAHELRSPVAVALAQVQRLQAETTDPVARDRVARLEGALQRMRVLVARLLQLARAESGIGQSGAGQDVGPLLALVIEEVAATPARAARITCSFPDRPVLSPIDPDAFAIVAGNLVENAFQHALPDSPIRVTLSDDAVLTVTNTANLIALDELGRLTERFSSGRNSSSGLGLGLYISDRIARQAGGKLHLRSAIIDGQPAFEAAFRLPVGRDGAGAPAPVRAA